MALNFPKNPMKGQVYDYAPFRYQWDGGRWLTSGRGAEPALEYVKAHEAATLIHSPDAIKWSEGVNQLIKSKVDGFAVDIQGKNNGHLWFRNDGVNRWVQYYNAHSTHDLVWARYNTAGTYLGTPLRLSMDTGRVGAESGIDAGDSTFTGWIRTIGDTGWYSSTHGGGWNMSDGMWLRSYGGKKVLITNGDTDAISVGGGITTGGPTAFTHNGGYITNHGHGNIGRYHGNTYSFLTSPSDAHLCCNSYWNGANWLKMDNSQPSSYIVVRPMGGANRAELYWSDAGSSNPQQYSANLITSQDATFDTRATFNAGNLLGGNGRYKLNQRVWGVGGARESVYECNFEGTTDYLFYMQRNDNGTQEFTFNGIGYAAQGWHTSSDSRVKKSIKPFNAGRDRTALDVVKNFSAKTFEYIESPGNTRLGFIAQEVQEHLDVAVSTQTTGGEDGSKELLSLDTMAIVALQHEAIKELAAKIERLEALLGRTK